MNLTNENIVHIKNNNVEILKFKKLNEYENIELAFSMKPFNFRSNGDLEKEYKEFFYSSNFDFNSLVKPHQNHTDNILVIEKKENINAPDMNLRYLENIDALITNSKNIILATTSADCLCVVLYDPKKEIIANIHSGWRGTFKKIVKKAVCKMKDNFLCDPKDIVAFFMPAIRVCHFEVDEDVMLECRNIFEYTNQIDSIIKLGRKVDGIQKYNIDNIMINKLLLEEEGLLESNIFDSNICSVCNCELVHSRRAEGEDFGLGTTVVMMK